MTKVNEHIPPWTELGDAWIEEKGRNHPETGYAYRELGKNMEALGQREQARQVHLQEREIFLQTLGAASPESSYWAVLEKRILSGAEL